MANRNNVLFLRVAADLDLVAGDALASLLHDHGDRPEHELEQALLRASLLTDHDMARVRAAMARLLERYDGDTTRAIEALAGESGDGADIDSMVTLAGAPAQWRVLSEGVNLDTADADTRYVDPVEHGRGGMGRILIVRDERMNRAVALKELIPPSDGAGVTVVGQDSARLSAHHVQRFLREARITGSLEHPSIIPVYELGKRPDGSHYYTMKLVRGQTLHQAIYEAHGLTQRLKLLPHVIDLCQAIAYAHDKGIVHRDIKPSNVMVGSFGETVVIDWGLARVLHQEDPYAADLEAFTAAQLTGDPEDPALTLAGLPVGTPHYMAPEQAEGRMDEVGTRSDVYSLGVVLYEVITGRTPFTGTTSRVVLQKVRTSDAPSVTAHEPSITPALAAICARAMARDPARRYASAGELAEELTRFTTGALVKGHEYSIGELIRHYYRRNRALSNTALAAAAVTLVVAVASYVYILDANHREREQRMAADAARIEAEGSAYRAGIQLAANYVEGQQFSQASALLMEQPAAFRNWEWGFLFEQCNQDYLTNTDHESPVHHLWSAPGGRLLTLGFQDQLAIRSLPDLEPLHRISVVGATTAYAVTSSDGSRMAIVRGDGRIPVYNMEDYSLVQEIRLDGVAIDDSAISGDGKILAVGNSDGTLYLWNCDSGEEVRRIAAHEGSCEVVGLNQGGTLALTNDRKGSAILWDTVSGEPRSTFAGDLLTRGERLNRFALRSGRAIQVFDVDSGARLFDSGDLQGNIVRLVISPDGQWVAALMDGGTLSIWDVATGRQSSSIRELAVTQILAFSPDGTHIALAVKPHGIEIRRTSDGSLVRTLIGHSNIVKAGAFDETGRMFYSCAGDREVKAWRVVETEVLYKRDPRTSILEFDLSDSGTLIGAGDGGGVVHLLNAETLQSIQTLASFDSHVYLAISPGGDKVAVALGAKTAHVIGIPGGEVLARRNGDAGDIHFLKFWDNGRSLVSLEQDRFVRTWDSATGSILLRFDVHQDRVTVLSVLSDGRMVSGDRSGRLLLWDGRTGQVERELRASGAALLGLACSPDGRWAAAAFEEGSAELYPLDEARKPRPLSNGSFSFRAFEFSEDGLRLTGKSVRNNFRMWEVESGQQLAIPNHFGSSYFPMLRLDSERNRAITCQSDTLRFLPSFPRQLYTNDDAITATSIREYKRGRLETSQRLRLNPKHYTALTTKPVVLEALGRLNHLAGGVREVAYVEPSGNPLARLGFRPGDSVSRINGVSDSSRDFLLRSLEAFATRDADEQALLTIFLMRGGEEVVIEHQLVAVLEQERTIVFPRARALELLQGTRELLVRQEQFMMEISQYLSNNRGAGLSGPRALEGAWIASPDTREDEAALAEIGLNSGNRIVAVNGTAISDYTQFLVWLDTAIDALEAGVVGSIRLRVERDRFQLLDLTWSVS